MHVVLQDLVQHPYSGAYSKGLHAQGSPAVRAWVRSRTPFLYPVYMRVREVHDFPRFSLIQ